MKIIIIGAGRVGASLVENLVSENNDITIIDTQESLLGVLGLKFDIHTILGNGNLPSVLAEAGAQSADMVIAVTFSDNTNWWPANSRKPNFMCRCGLPACGPAI
ncbi:MAG TPA: hypothetical protein DCZ48_16010, partial [Methylococcaceae bacterium]|nr:hypothetical protein [Methylococcaceae bacterium]